MPSVQPWARIYEGRMSKNKNSPSQLVSVSPFSRAVGARSRYSGLCFELVAAMEARVGLGFFFCFFFKKGNRLLPPPVMSSPGGRSSERRQHVMLFLASCSEGFVRKLREILSMAVSMWGVGYNRDSSSRQTQTCQIWVILLLQPVHS